MPVRLQEPHRLVETLRKCLGLLGPTNRRGGNLGAFAESFCSFLDQLLVMPNSQW